jgi:hypothetical protein
VDLERVAPELRQAAKRASLLPIHRRLGRAVIGLLFAVLPDGKVGGVSIEKPGGVEPGVRVYRPSTIRSPAALLWIHGLTSWTACPACSPTSWPRTRGLLASSRALPPAGESDRPLTSRIA